MVRIGNMLLPFAIAALLAACGKPCRPGFEQCRLSAYSMNDYLGYNPRTGPGGSYCPPYCQYYAPGPDYPRACSAYCSTGAGYQPDTYQFPSSPPLPTF